MRKYTSLNQLRKLTRAGRRGEEYREGCTGKRKYPTQAEAAEDGCWAVYACSDHFHRTKSAAMLKAMRKAARG